MAKKVYYTDFGCRLNQFETRVLENASDDILSVPTPEEADYIVINTCTVTGRADMKNRQIIRKSRLANPDAKIIVTGCYASTDNENIKKADPEAIVVPNQQKFNIPGIILGKTDSPAPGLFPTSKQNTNKNARAYLKIQDGCNKKCSYCKIPAARGAGVSRDVESTISEVHDLVAAGFNEIILTGVNIGHYQANGVTFNELLGRLSEIPGNHFYRISSIEPECINEEFLKILANGRFARFLHIPVQSGSDNILRGMRRGYNREFYSRKIDLARTFIPDIHLGTDIMTGFPGESDDDFQATKDLVTRSEFSNVHFFPFSKRSGSDIEKKIRERDPAFFEINGNVVRERIKKLMALQQEILQNYRFKTSGKNYRAIVESISGNIATVITENYLRGEIPCSQDLAKGGLVNVSYTPDGVFFREDRVAG